MIVYRITKDRYARDLSGSGAEKAGGRWKSKGTPVLYASQSRALAALELSVHITPSILPTQYKMVSIQIPEIYGIYEIKSEELVAGWNMYPFHPSTQKQGNNWANNGEYLIMKVPCALIAEEFNYAINPLHQNFREVSIIEIKDFEFDMRLFS